MKYLKRGDSGSVLTFQAPPRIAVVGAGIAGLTCARELCLRGFDPVVFEANDRLGGRCSSRTTRSGVFDDGAQFINGVTRLASYVVQRPGELESLHAWTVPVASREDESNAKDTGEDGDEDEADSSRSLKLVGAVGVPSMRSLANAVARPLEVRLNTPIRHAQRRGPGWILQSDAGEIDGDFQALVLAIPAPLALPLARESSQLAAALKAVRYRSRWVLLLGSERAVCLPGHREFRGSPIERIAAMHSKPGRTAGGPQRWFVEADALWSLQHEHDDAETVAELLLDNFRAHAGRAVTPSYLRAYQWRHAFVERPATMPGYFECLWDYKARLGVCGDSAAPSQVDRVHASGVALARAMVDSLNSGRAYNAATLRDRDHDPVHEQSKQLEVEL